MPKRALVLVTAAVLEAVRHIAIQEALNGKTVDWMELVSGDCVVYGITSEPPGTIERA